MAKADGLDWKSSLALGEVGLRRLGTEAINNPERVTQIVEASLDYPDAERLFDRSNLRVTGRAIAVERHGEDFVSEFEAKLRERAAKAELRLDQS